MIEKHLRTLKELGASVQITQEASEDFFLVHVVDDKDFFYATSAVKLEDALGEAIWKLF